jgi:hypothetical protein
MSDCSATDELRESRRDRLAKIMSIGVPIDAHVCGALFVAIAMWKPAFPASGANVRTVVAIRDGTPPFRDKVPAWEAKREWSREIQFEVTAPHHPQFGEHRSVENEIGTDWCPRDVLNTGRRVCASKALTDRRNEIDVLSLRVTVVSVGEGLAGWRRPNEIESVERIFECVGLVELKRVAGFVLDIDANDFESGAMQSHRRPTSATEQVESAELHYAASPSRAGCSDVGVATEIGGRYVVGAPLRSTVTDLPDFTSVANGSEPQ